MTAIANPFLSIAEIDAWGVIGLGNTYFPGIVVDVDGATRPYEWAVQRGLGLSGAATIYRAEQLAEGIKVVCHLTNAIHWREWEAFHAFTKPKKGTRPTAFPITHPAFAAADIAKVVFKERPSPKHAGKRLWIVEYPLLEYRKPIVVPTGPADPAKEDGPPKPKDWLDEALQGLLKKIEDVSQ